MRRVSRGRESGRMKYRIVEPRMFMVSSEIGSCPLGVIFTVRSAVFICGDTDVMVPCTIVPVRGEGGAQKNRAGCQLLSLLCCTLLYSSLLWMGDCYSR